MYYLIGIRENYHPLGNAGSFITRYKSMKKIEEVAMNLAKMYQLDEVYLIKTYTQKMCELSASDFVNYIRQNGIRYV